MSKLEKYRRAGLVTQAGLSHAFQLLHANIGEVTCGEICRETDALVSRAALQGYRSVKEKGMAFPTEICRNEFVRGVCPEPYDIFQGGMPGDGDIVTVSLGVHIDGYAAFGAHTVVIREGTPSDPFAGRGSDACVAAFLATEATISLLAAALNPSHPLLANGPVSGSRIRALVESVAYSFNCVVVPGSRVRRVSQFLAAQPAIHEANSKAVEWHEEADPEAEAAGDNWQANAGEAYVVDISMTEKGPETLKLKEFHGYGSDIDSPSAYNRDYTVSYSLKTPASRAVLAQADRRSVFPFKLSWLAEDAASANRLRSGLRECVQRRLLVAMPRLVAPRPVAREAATVVLVEAGTGGATTPELLRLTGGKRFPSSWVHSQYELIAGDAADCLNILSAPHTGVRYMDVQGKVDGFTTGFEKEASAQSPNKAAGNKPTMDIE